MAQRTSYERAHSELSAFELEDIADERLPLDPGAYTTLPTFVTDDRASEAPTSIHLGQHSSTSSSHILESEAKQDEPEVTATLRRSTLHEWISTVFDVFLSLIPLFFLGLYSWSQIWHCKADLNRSNCCSLSLSGQEARICLRAKYQGPYIAFANHLPHSVRSNSRKAPTTHRTLQG
jgi:hypothetical protein